MSTPTAMRRITAAVTAWPGVEAGPGARGEVSFRFRGRELGHLHGDRAAHFSFPRELGEELRRDGRVDPHPVAPESMKWAARRIESDADVLDVIALMRLNYDRLVERPDRTEAKEGQPGASGLAAASRSDGSDTSPHPLH